jgi:hypothetical protein
MATAILCPAAGLWNGGHSRSLARLRIVSEVPIRLFGVFWQSDGAGPAARHLNPPLQKCLKSLSAVRQLSHDSR